MRDTVYAALWGLIFGLCMGVSVASIAINDSAIEKAGQVACRSIGKSWVFMDGHYDCVTVTP